MSAFELLQGDCKQVLATLPAGSVQCCITSPPYWGLRDYQTDGQLGLEPTPEEYVANIVAVFRAVRRVLRDDGTLWLNLGDSYASDMKSSGGPTPKQTSNAGSFYEPRKLQHGLKPKDLVGIPWRVAFALQADGWYLRQDIIWHKPNPMPESVTDRCTKAHEYIFLLTKQPKYYYDNEAVKEAGNYEPATRDKSAEGYTADYAFGDRFSSGARQYGVAGKRNKRSVWTVTTKPYKGAHFATFPLDLIEPCVLAGSKPGDTLLDPFNGAGTTGVVAMRHGRRYIGIELNPDYLEMSRKRIQLVRDSITMPMFTEP